MLFYLHYILLTSGLSGTSVLLAVYFREYTDASQSEIGILLMSFPFVNLLIKPLFCSMADRRQAHRKYLIWSLIIEMIGYLPFAIFPFFPDLYQIRPRLTWYMLILSCYVGNCALDVAWSLGDCLAINYAQKNNTTFGRMRLMGTMSWGVYGFIIGQINETPLLPKYTPAFLILHLSLLVEIVLMCCWKAEDFVMFDPLASINIPNLIKLEQFEQQQQQQNNKTTTNSTVMDGFNAFADSLPSSLGGTSRFNANVAGLFRDQYQSPTCDDLTGRLSVIAAQQQNSHNDMMKNLELGQKDGSGKGFIVQQQQQQSLDNNHKLTNGCKSNEQRPTTTTKRKNPQMILLKMIFLEDGRLLKYICLFTIIGLLLAPMNFTFLSIEEVSAKRGYNFSQLAGYILISQAAMETLGFLVTPWVLQRVSRSKCVCFAYLINAMKYFFYANWYYNDDVSPYWAVLSEWGLGISFAVFITIQADVALMFANQSRLFIPELRRLGYLSEVSPDKPKEVIEAEEASVKMALRATMQAIFDGFLRGFGQGAGVLICGVFIEVYNYITLWQFFYIVSLSALIIHQICELSRCRWSDSYKPLTGTKAHQIKQLEIINKKRMINTPPTDGQQSGGKIGTDANK